MNVSNWKEVQDEEVMGTGPVTHELVCGFTRDDNGVPLGLINWMIQNRRETGIEAQRIGRQVGYIWFVFLARAARRRFHVWEFVRWM